PGFVGVALPLLGPNARFGLEVTTTGQDHPLEAPTQVLFESPTPVSPMFKAGSSQNQGALAGLLNSSLRFKLVGLGLENLVTPAQREQRNQLQDWIMNTLGQLLANTIDPLLRVLGVNIGSADIMLYDIQSHPASLVDVSV